MQFNDNIVKLYSPNIKYSSHSHNLKKRCVKLHYCFKKLNNKCWLIFNEYLPHSAEICARYAQIGQLI